MKTEVKLTDDLLLTLDGCGDPDVQAAIDRVRERLAIAADHGTLTEGQAQFVAKALALARTSGRLDLTRVDLVYCDVCKKRAGYAKYKSGPRRGKNNYDKQLSFYGVDLGVRSVSMRGYANCGCCQDCWDAAKPVLIQRLPDVPAQVSKFITGEDPKYTRHDIRSCSSCGWEGSERLMTRRRTLMGDGTYPAGCPECGAENLFMGRTFITTVSGKFELHPVS